MRLTVVIPAYNAAPFIRRTLISLTNQTRPIHEIIIVDDGSTDQTLSTVKDFVLASAIPGFTIIRQENSGVSAARNAGLAAATGEYVLFLDADDLVHPSLVDRLDSVASGAPDVICWRFERLSDDGKPLPTFAWSLPALSERSSGGETLARILEGKHWIWGGSSVYRMDMLQRRGLHFSEGCEFGEDTEFIFKALSDAARVVWIDEVLSSYIKREGSVINLLGVRPDKAPDPRLFDAARAEQRAASYLARNPEPDIARLSHAVTRRAVEQYVRAVTKLEKKGFSPSQILATAENRHPGLTNAIRKEARAMAIRRSPVLTSWLFLMASAVLFIEYTRFRRTLAASFRAVTARVSQSRQ